VIVLLFGPPGCGKGTQATRIAERFHIPAISTGEMFRAECRAGTDLGRVKVPGKGSSKVSGLSVGTVVRVDTPGVGFVEITEDAVSFVKQAGAGEGVLLIYLRHTSASLTIQENADPDVQADLVAALDRLAPEDAPWIHDTEGPDDMPAHVKAMLNGVSLQVPVVAGKLALGTWQGMYLVEHRRRPHSREVIFQFIGSRKPA